MPPHAASSRQLQIAVMSLFIELSFLLIFRVFYTSAHAIKEADQATARAEGSLRDAIKKNAGCAGHAIRSRINEVSNKGMAGCCPCRGRIGVIGLVDGWRGKPPGLPGDAPTAISRCGILRRFP
ncbi:Hypothetical protein H16_B2036 [Cupriavidus necator H16]|uniref:Uncharacterized protein n=1 Tax=Cupriavidus necator (strain ATCC 17699 / DSM 428 / KCTC 22496 / NCIMB 10442 / H16 / Stanier 337) TaxID=381666 RepID=Q0JZK6_CUPNH|nr:Hypothetical protein H16_B2036 [Cupriavidus necator H16]